MLSRISPARIQPFLSGSALALLVALLSLWLVSAWIPASAGITPLHLSLIAGCVLAHSLPASWQSHCAAGLGWSRQTLLRLGIALYGLQVSWSDLAALGPATLRDTILVVFSTIALAAWAGPRLLGLNRRESLLIGVGNGICGAAAIMAASDTLRARQQETQAAVAGVMIFGTLSMLLYPYLASLLHLSLHGTARALGGTIQEVAQVLVAARQFDADALPAAIGSKMFRVILLTPVILLLNRSTPVSDADGTRTQSRPAAVPWFILAFIAVITIHPFLQLSAGTHTALIKTDQLMLTMAMFALGMQMQIPALIRGSRRTLGLGAILWVWLTICAALIAGI